MTLLLMPQPASPVKLTSVRSLLKGLYDQSIIVTIGITLASVRRGVLLHMLILI